MQKISALLNIVSYVFSEKKQYTENMEWCKFYLHKQLAVIIFSGLSPKKDNYFFSPVGTTSFITFFNYI